MKLEGSCHCGAVKFTAVSHTPFPFNYCYCSICRKVNGGGGFNINIMADANTLDVTGMENVGVYRSRENQRGAYDADGLGFSRRHFCKTCATMLWSFNPNYPDWVYPYAALGAADAFIDDAYEPGLMTAGVYAAMELALLI